MAKILNIAHRGFTRNHPDNTLEAFSAAIELGVDGIECDVQETADNNFIIFHDNNIKETRISDMSLADIQQVRIQDNYRIPTLNETLELCHRHTFLNLELKQVSSIDKLLQILQATMTPDELLLSSFQSTLITKLRDLTPDFRYGILTGLQIKDFTELMNSTRAQVMLPMFASVTMTMVDKLHNSNLSIIVWNCNTLKDMGIALSYNVDGIITDNPDMFLLEMSDRK